MRSFVCFLLVAFASCDSRSPIKNEGAGSSQRDPSPRVVEKIEDVRGSSVVRGQVKFVGTPPAMEEIANQPCHAGAPKLKEETVVLGPTAGLANVFVRIDGLPPVDGSTLPPAKLDQVHCRYVPHAVGVCVSQPLLVRSSDDTMHNVHWDPTTNAPANFGLTRAGSDKTVSFRASEFIKVRCDVHPWMSATIGVFENPFFAVTDADGRYEIDNLPPGKYKLIAWHERYGELVREVEVKDAAAAAPVEAEIVYQAP